MVSVSIVNVMITSNNDDSQYDNGQSSHVTVRSDRVAVVVPSLINHVFGSVTVYAATVWQYHGVRSDSVTASVNTAAE